jgi:hypothetical protein
MRVTVLTVLPDNLRIVERVVDQEALWVLIDVDVDLRERSMDGRGLNSFTGAVLKPVLNHT